MTTANERQVGGNHYKKPGLQHWDLMSRNNVGYLEGNLTKYLRHRKKKGLEDVEKMMHYADKILDCIKEFQYGPSGQVPYSQLDTFCLEQDYNDIETLIMVRACRWQNADDIEEIKNAIGVLIHEYKTT